MGKLLKQYIGGEWVSVVTGERGATGPQGDPGGATGATGLTGSTGLTGPAGADSTVPGPQGATGATGPAGTNGTNGVDGATGLTGATGPTGATGVFANQFTANIDAAGYNISNVAFITANNISSAGNLQIYAASGKDLYISHPSMPMANIGMSANNVKLQGIVDVIGNFGVTGNISGGNILSNGYYYANGAPYTGNTGATGPQGPAGTNGTNGTDGATGLTGATGIQGPAGNDGAVGATGLTGATGVAGTNGTNGLDGATGLTGATGPAGTNGTNGTDGATGLTGATGPQGPSGLDGAAGAQGATGLTGATGTFSGTLTANIDGAGYNISNVNTISTTGNINSGNAVIYVDAGGYSVLGSLNPGKGAFFTNGVGNVVIGAHESLGALIADNWGTSYNTIALKDANLNFNALGSGPIGITNVKSILMDRSDARITTNYNWDPASANATTPATGRILIGSGYNGNTSYQYDSNGGARAGRLVVLDSGSMGDTQQRLVGTYTQIAATATANITNGNTRFLGGSNQLVIGGGAAGNTINNNTLSAVTGGFNSVIVGTSGNLAVGNTQLGHATGVAGFVLPQTGSTVGNAVGVLGQIITQGTGNITNSIGVFASLPNNTTGNAIAFYQPGTTNNYGLSIGSASNTRGLNNYYFVKTDDPSAKSDLGALNVYNEVAYATGSPSTAGVLAVNRSNGGCQYMILSENVTNMSLSNFQSVFTIGSKTQYAFDTVTLLINANGYSLSLPATLNSGQTAKYANGTAVGPASTGDYFIVLTNTPLGVYITISPVFS